MVIRNSSSKFKKLKLLLDFGPETESLPPVEFIFQKINLK
jgi:hypothetical protein